MRCFSKTDFEIHAEEPRRGGNVAIIIQTSCFSQMAVWSTDNVRITVIANAHVNTVVGDRWGKHIVPCMHRYDTCRARAIGDNDTKRPFSEFATKAPHDVGLDSVISRCHGNIV